MRNAFTVVVLLVAGCIESRPTPDASTSPSLSPELEPLDTFTYTGSGCEELGLTAIIAADDVRPFVPPQYTLIGEDEGRAVLSIAFAECDRMLEHEGATPTLVSQTDISVYVEDPEGGPAYAAYEIYYTTTSAELAANISRTGFQALASDPDLHVVVTGMGAETITAGTEAGKVALFGEANAGRGPATGPAGGAYYFSDENGTAIMQYTVDIQSIGPASGELRTKAGTPLAKILGGTSVPAAGFYGTFGTLEGEATRVEG